MKDDDRQAILARRALFVSAALSTVGLSGVARAQPSGDAGVDGGGPGDGTPAQDGEACAPREATLSEAEVERHAKLALKHLEREELGPALELAEQAWLGSGEQEQSALLVWGQVLQAAGRFVAARDAYQRLLDCHSPDPATRTRVEEKLKFSASQIARLTIDLRPGASVKVDGRRLADPHGKLEFDPGEHIVELEIDSFLCSSTVVQLAPGSDTFMDSESCAAPQVCLSPPPPPPRHRKGLRRPAVEVGLLGWVPVRDEPTNEISATPIGAGARVYATYGLSEEFAWQGGGVILVGDRTDGLWMPMGFSVSTQWLPGPLRFALGAAGGYAFSRGSAAGFFVMPEVTPLGLSLGSQAALEARVSLPFNGGPHGFGLDSVAAGLWFSWVVGGEEDEELMAGVF